MPIFDYKCRKCNLEVDVLRSISESDKPPVEGEGEEVTKDCPQAPHEWRKQIKTKITVQKGWGWGGGKGHWVLLVCALTKLTGFPYEALSHMDWKAYSRARTQCSVLYPASPCLVAFEKRAPNNYWAICGAGK